MASFLKLSTAVDVMLGPFLDSVDGNTIEGGLTITAADIRLSKNGGAFAPKSAAQTLTHGENGWYSVNLSTNDTNTGGSLIVAVHESGALPVWREFFVVSANVYDSLLGNDFLLVDVAQWIGIAPLGLSGNRVQSIIVATAGGVIDSSSFAAGAITATTIASDAITAAKIASDAITAAKVADGTIDATTFAAGAINAAAIAPGAIDDDALAADMDSYTTRSWIGRQGTTADKYIVQWFKNGQLISTGITVPLISVFDDTGTDLIAETAMTEIGSRQCFKFIEATNTLTPGEVYIMQVKATIDGLTRMDRQPIMRDSS